MKPVSSARHTNGIWIKIILSLVVLCFGMILYGVSTLAWGGGYNYSVSSFSDVTFNEFIIAARVYCLSLLPSFIIVAFLFKIHTLSKRLITFGIIFLISVYIILLPFTASMQRWNILKKIASGYPILQYNNTSTNIDNLPKLEIMINPRGESIYSINTKISSRVGQNQSEIQKYPLDSFQKNQVFLWADKVSPEGGELLPDDPNIDFDKTPGKEFVSVIFDTSIGQRGTIPIFRPMPTGLYPKK